MSSPAAADDVVAAISQDGYIYGLAAATGEQRWRYQTGFAVESSPALAGGGSCTWGQMTGISTPWDAYSGELLWRYLTEGEVLGSPVFVWGVVYVGADDGYVYALDAESGELLWRAETRDFVFHAPVVVQGVVYVGSNAGGLYALDAETGLRLWWLKVDSAVQAAPVVMNGRAYVITERGFVYGLYAYGPEPRYPSRIGGDIGWHFQTKQGVLLWRRPYR